MWVSVIAGAIHKPQRCGYLRIQKQFGGQIYNAVDQVAIGDERLAYLAFAAGFSGESAFGQHHACFSWRFEVVRKVLQPGEVGIARRRCAVLPTVIAAQQRAAPITDVEWRVGDDEVGFQVFVSVVEKGAFVVLFHLRRINAA